HVVDQALDFRRDLGDRLRAAVEGVVAVLEDRPEHQRSRRPTQSSRSPQRTTSLIRKIIYDTLDATVGEASYIEIEQQTNIQPRGAQIGQHLRKVHAIESFDGLYLNDDQLFDKEVDSKTTVHALGRDRSTAAAAVSESCNGATVARMRGTPR